MNRSRFERALRGQLWHDLSTRKWSRLGRFGVWQLIFLLAFFALRWNSRQRLTFHREQINSK